MFELKDWKYFQAILIVIPKGDLLKFCYVQQRNSRENLSEADNSFNSSDIGFYSIASIRFARLSLVLFGFRTGPIRISPEEAARNRIDSDLLRDDVVKYEIVRICC